MAGNDLTAFVPQIWSKRVLKRLDRINVALACGAVNHDFEGEIKAAGDTVFVRTYGNVTMMPYRRGTAISYQNLAPSKEALTINDAAYFTFKVDDLDEAQNDLSAIDGYSQRAAVAMNELIDTKCFGYTTSAATANQVTSGGSAYTIDADTSYTTLVDAGKRLDLQNVPSEGRWAVVGPTHKAFLLQSTKYFVRATELGDTVVRMGRLEMAANKAPGFIGQAAGFNLFTSTGLPTDSTGTYCPFGAPGVISYAGQIRKIQRITLQDEFAEAVRGLILHDGTVFAEHAKGLGYILESAI